MSLSRWNPIKRWILKQSKSKPAQVCLSIAAGGSFASGMYYAGEFLLSFVPAGSSALTALTAIEYALIGTAFFATTILTASGLAVSITDNNQLNQWVSNLSNEFKHIKLRQQKQKEALVCLSQNSTHFNKTQTEHFNTLKQLQAIASLFIKYIPNQEDKESCEKMLLSLPTDNHRAAASVVIEPYFDEEYVFSDDPLNNDSHNIEMINMNPSRATSSRSNYGTLFNSPVSISYTDIESGLSDPLANSYKP